MKLILMNEWLGPGKRMPASTSMSVDETNRLVSFATELPINTALERILAYQAAYNAHYSLAVNFRLLSVTDEVEYISRDLLDKLEIALVEALPKHADEIGL